MADQTIRLLHRRRIASKAMACNHRPPIAYYRRNAAFLFLLVLLLVIPQCAAQTTAPSPKNINQTNPTNFSPSMATVVVVLISAFFFLVFFSVYVRQCAGEAAAIAAAERAGVRSGRRRVVVGLKQEVLETFPTMAYAEAKALKVGHGDLECAVCLSEFEDDETLRLLPGCCHVFHPDCIDAWLACHITCPVCRSDLTAVALEQPPASFAASPGSDAADPPPDPVVIVIANRCPTEEEAMELARIGSVKREERSKRGRRPAKFPRSHSTGHSLAQPLAVEDGDRYTLRLPPHIQRELFAARKFHRSTSCVSFPVAGDGSSRPGYRIGVGTAGEWSGRGGWGWRLGKSDRWPSLIRNLSTRMPSRKRGDNDESVKKGEAESSKGKFGSVRTPFDCLGGSGGVKAGLLVDERPLPQ